MSVAVSHFHPSPIFPGKAGAYLDNGLHSEGRLQALPEHITICLKWLKGTDYLAYYNTDLTMAVEIL